MPPITKINGVFYSINDSAVGTKFAINGHTLFLDMQGRLYHVFDEISYLSHEFERCFSYVCNPPKILILPANIEIPNFIFGKSKSRMQLISPVSMSILKHLTVGLKVFLSSLYIYPPIK